MLETQKCRLIYLNVYKIACQIKRRGLPLLGSGLLSMLSSVRRIDGRDHRISPNLNRRVLPSQQVMFAVETQSK